MFFKSGQLEVLNTVSQSELERPGTIVNQGGKNFFATYGTHEKIAYEPDKYVYFRARAITADVPNGNADYFAYDEVNNAYLTFIGKPLFLEHNSFDIENNVGKIFASKMVEGIDGNKEPDRYVENLCGVDIIRRPDIAEEVKHNMKKTVSMGCLVGLAVCSCCGKEYRTPMEYCMHMNPSSAFFIKGQKFANQVSMMFPIVKKNPIIYEINKDLCFQELSLVEYPADPSAHVFEIWSSLKNILGSQEKANKYLDMLLAYFKGEMNQLDDISDVEQKEFSQVLTELKAHFNGRK